MRCHLLPAAAVVAAASTLTAQAPAQSAAVSRPAFDVVSIKRSPPDARGGSIGAEPGGLWVMRNVVVAALIRSAYPAKVSELPAAPDWVNADRYDVMAKAEGNPPREQMIPMLQTLLAERFKFLAHYETRDYPVFALVMARSDRRPGPNLRRVEIDCDAVNAARREGRTPEGAVPSNGAPLCGYSMNGATLRFGGLPLSRLADVLGGNLAGRPVIDKTELPGNYEFTLDSTIDPVPAGDAPSVFTALQEQLGLKLVSDRAPLQVLVVDRIERPTEN